MKILIFIVFFASTIFAQSTRYDYYYWMSGGAVFAVDLATNESMAKSNPTGLDLNGTDRVTFDVDSDFEVVLAYASDFSAGVDGWAATDVGRGDLTGNVDGIFGEDDVLRIEAETHPTAKAEIRKTGIFAEPIVGSYRFSFLYYIQSAGSSTDITVRFGAGKSAVSISGFTKGSWTTATLTELPVDDEVWIKFVGAAEGDSVYLKDMSISLFPGYADAGNHSFDSTSVDPLTDSYSGKITASGVGDSTTNFVSLAADRFTTLVAGEKYTLEIEVKAVLADTDVTIVIGGKAKVFTAVDQTSEILVFTFLVTSAEVGQKIIIYLSQADDLFIDEVTLSQSFDLTILAWVKTSTAAFQTIFASTSSLSGSGIGYTLRITSEGKINPLIQDGTVQISLVGTDVIKDGTWHLVGTTINRTGSMRVFNNGVETDDTDITSVGRAVNPNDNFGVGVQVYNSSQFWTGQIGEVQIIKGILTDAQMLNANTRGEFGKHFSSSYPGLTVVAHYWWRGGSNADFLIDRSDEGNDLTGTNVTRADDQVKLNKYKD